MTNSAVTNLLSSPGMKLPNTLLIVVLLGKIWGALKIHSMVVSIISNQNLILSLKNLLGNSTSQPVHSIHL